MTDVSIVIPTRNRSALLQTTLRSALGQKGVNIEVIVVDEASDDDTPSVLAGISDRRLRVIRNDRPLGLPGARNRGGGEARGEWLVFLDDDDLWAPDKLVRQVRAAADAGCEWAYTGAVNFEGRRIVYSRPPLPPQDVVAALRRYNAIPGGGSNVVMRRSTWRRVGPFEPRFRNGGEDWEMSIRLAKIGRPAWVCSPLVGKRVHASNMSLDTEEIVRATRLIESLHGTTADWGRVHRWLAERYLRSGNRRAASVQFARAAVRGQLPGVISDLGAIARRRLRRNRSTERRPAARGSAWTAAALEWLREFGIGVQ
jgi:glycosyltransferase involved in cell wall biosynthesis